ncbi:MAG: transposase [Gammaproteobacteria bacterium]|jgi:putative transposase|nr:transposase [Gammaproteobacteria bacterium]
MSRTARHIVPGLCYHVLNRGNNRATVFHDPADFEDFIALARDAQDRQPLPILAACLMPNHFHLVVRPGAGTDVSTWLHWLLTSHAFRRHRRHGSSGRVWTGRFKSFPIQDDRHLVTVLRYVERNALRAGLVPTAEEWRWGSLNWRERGRLPLVLAQPPSPLPSNWRDFVNEPQTPQEIAEIRRCVTRGVPFGEATWSRATARLLGIPDGSGRRGRPPRSTVAA